MVIRYCSCGKKFKIQFTDNGLILYEDEVHYKVCSQCGKGNYANELLVFSCSDKKEYYANSMEALRIRAISVYIDNFRDLKLYNLIKEKCEKKQIEFPDVIEISRKENDDREVIGGYYIYHTYSRNSDYPILEYQENDKEIESLFMIAKLCTGSVWIERSMYWINLD